VNPEKTAQVLANMLVPGLRDLMNTLNEALPCKQFQLAIMDAEAMIENLQSLEEDGPLPRLMEIPLSQSEIQQDFIFPEDQVELAYYEEPRFV
jgi:hypothetical protein